MYYFVEKAVYLRSDAFMPFVSDYKITVFFSYRTRQNAKKTSNKRFLTLQRPFVSAQRLLHDYFFANDTIMNHPRPTAERKVVFTNTCGKLNLTFLIQICSK